MDFGSILMWIILGALAGWIASMIMKTDGQQGWVANIIIGILGAVVGGWLAGFFNLGGADLGSFNIMSIIIAIVGACILLFLYKLVTGRKA